MAERNKRLSGQDRDALINYATKLVRQTEDSSALDAAYSAAAAAIRAELERQFPPKDMKVLQRYDTAVTDRCIYVSRGYYDRDRFTFRDDEEAPLRPAATNCNHRTFGLDGDALSAFDAFKLVAKEHEDNIKRRVADFRALITGVNTFNEVAAVWPDAEKLRTTICGSNSAMIVLSNDVIDRLKADPAFSVEEAA